MGILGRTTHQIGSALREGANTLGTLGQQQLNLARKGLQSASQVGSAIVKGTDGPNHAFALNAAEVLSHITDINHEKGTIMFTNTRPELGDVQYRYNSDDLVEALNNLRNNIYNPGDSESLNNRAVLLKDPNLVFTVIELAGLDSMPEVQSSAKELVAELTARTQKQGFIAGLLDYKHSYAGDLITAKTDKQKLEALDKFLSHIRRNNLELGSEIAKVTDRIKGSFKEPVGSAIAGRFSQQVINFLKEPDLILDREGNLNDGSDIETFREDNINLLESVHGHLRAIFEDSIVSEHDKSSRLVQTALKILGSVKGSQALEDAQKEFADIIFDNSTATTKLLERKDILNEALGNINDPNFKHDIVAMPFDLINDTELQAYCSKAGITYTNREDIIDDLKAQGLNSLTIEVNRSHKERILQALRTVDEELISQKKELTDGLLALEHTYNRMSFRAQDPETGIINEINGIERILNRRIFGANQDDETFLFKDVLDSSETDEDIVVSRILTDITDTFTDLPKLDRIVALKVQNLYKQSLNEAKTLEQDIKTLTEANENFELSVVRPFDVIFNYSVLGEDSQIDKLVSFLDASKSKGQVSSADSLIKSLQSTSKNLQDFNKALIKAGKNPAEAETICNNLIQGKDIGSEIVSIKDPKAIEDLRSQAELMNNEANNTLNLFIRFTELKAKTYDPEDLQNGLQILNSQFIDAGIPELNITNVAELKINFEKYLTSSERLLSATRRLEQLETQSSDQKEAWVKENFKRAREKVVTNYKDNIVTTMKTIKPKAQDISDLVANSQNNINLFAGKNKSPLMEEIYKMLNSLINEIMQLFETKE